MIVDLRLWVLIMVSALLLVTIELTEDYLEQGWPRVRRPADGWTSSEGVRLLWTMLGLLVFPGIVFLLANLALLVWRNVAWPALLLVGGVLLGIGWIVYLVLVSQLAGLDDYLESVGIPLPLALLAIVLLGDLFLVLTLLDLVPDVALQQLLS